MPPRAHTTLDDTHAMCSSLKECWTALDREVLLEICAYAHVYERLCHRDPSSRPPPPPICPPRRAAPHAYPAPRMTWLVHCSLVSCLPKFAVWMFFFIEAG